MVEATEDSPRWRPSGGRDLQPANQLLLLPSFSQNLNHSANFTTCSTLNVIFYHYYLLLVFFLHQSKRFSPEKSDILRGNLLMWDRPGCNIGWRRWSWIHYFPAATSRCRAAEATPTLFIINLEHFYLAQSYTAFYSAMNVILLPSSAWM